ncbi:hypothetical protein J1N35_041526 [Gossypium stocksii]|uniref:Uncharacterized protein n=1 Tax=Gossypium stocksii TaxID=47602 RepID=A0A9D3UG52_9ROSI|nr:hypothetical protein J1N35_041526 [Gossypium stocksii]
MIKVCFLLQATAKQNKAMGNCLAQQQKLIRVMKTDGKILEYQPPIKVEQVLSDFPAHAISDTFSGFHHFQPDAKLLPGHLYYLVPLPSTAINKCKEKKELIQKQGVTVQDMGSQKHKSDAIGNSGGWKWKPVLESIDEVN